MSISDSQESQDSFQKKFTILEEIGAGSFSQVYKCKDIVTGELFACKKLNEKLKSMRQARKLAEVGAANLLRGKPNIVQLLEIHYNKSSLQVSLIFGLMDTDLYSIIKDRNDFLPNSRVRSIMFQLLTALSYVHKQGIFHCDVKPENILVKLPQDLVKLGDFGNARKIRNNGIPFAQGYVATRWYRPPECILTDGYYGYKIDIWAAGCIFYEIMTLEPLFPGVSEMDQIKRIHDIIGPPPPNVLQVFCNCIDKQKRKVGPTSPKHERFDIIDKLLTDIKCSESSVSAEDDTDWGSDSNQPKSGLDSLLLEFKFDVRSLLKDLIQYDPNWRPNASEALNYYSYFKESQSQLKC